MKTNLVLLILLFAFSPVVFCASVTDMFPDKEEIPKADQIMMKYYLKHGCLKNEK